MFRVQLTKPFGIQFDAQGIVVSAQEYAAGHGVTVPVCHSVLMSRCQRHGVSVRSVSQVRASQVCWYH